MFVLLQLENVKETETYKKAKEILEKFAPEKSRHLEVKFSSVSSRMCACVSYDNNIND